MTLLDTTLGQLAREIPGATAIFHHHRLDFCCAGQQTLAQACDHKSLDGEAIAAELQALNQVSAQDQWQQSDNTALIEHILSRYHDVHRQQLPELIRLAARVELVHGGHPACPVGLTDQLERMQEELLAHMQKEERILFPMIARGITGMAVGPVSMMRAEHLDHGEALEALRRLTRDFNLPSGACNTWTALYKGLETLMQDLMDHIHLENNILFERIDGQRGAAHG